MTKNLMGVMQGRLLPKFKGRYQAHPVGYWQDEFPIAAALKLNLIEWILDYNDAEKNPITSDAGIQKIKDIAQQTGVQVQTVCADYFMEAPLHSADQGKAKESARVLYELIERGARLGLTNIVIPCVDQSKIATPHDLDRLVQILREYAPLAGRSGIFLSLETDLGASEFANVLRLVDSPYVSVNYDTGNSASLGYLPSAELAAYGSRITDIHIKDRRFNGGSVQLGSGDTRFDEFFNALVPLNYNGPFIMQAFRDDEGLEIFKSQLIWARKKLNDYGFEA